MMMNFLESIQGGKLNKKKTEEGKKTPKKVFWSNL